MSAWQAIELFKRNGQPLPKAAGVYAVYFGNEVVYVGSTCNLANRFHEHRIRYGYGKNIITPWADMPDTARVYIKFKQSRRLGQWAMDEIRLIAKIQPVFNTQHRQRKRA